jgi:hypothetical protein
MNAWIVAGVLATAPLAGARGAETVSEPPPSAPGKADAAGSEAERAALEALIAKELGAGPSGDAVAPAAAATPGTGASPYARLLAMPDLSAVASFAAAWNDYDVAALSPRSGPYAPRDSLAFLLQEVELSLRSVIDPYARAEVYLSVGPEGAAVEEAFLTTTALPAGLQVKAGQLRSPFGRINSQHPHTWDFVDAPLSAGRLVADEALAGPGVDLSWLAPLPWFAELHVAAQTTAPVAGEEGRLTGIARLSQFFALSEAMTLGVGLSGGRRGEGQGEVSDRVGSDLYLRWRPGAARTALALQGEIFGRRFSAGSGDFAWGGYGQLFWRAGARAGMGARYEQAPVAGVRADERRYSAVATWFLSEFQRLRLQVAHEVRADGRSGAEALLQAEFGIGAHGAHPF